MLSGRNSQSPLPSARALSAMTLSSVNSLQLATIATGNQLNGALLSDSSLWGLPSLSTSDLLDSYKTDQLSNVFNQLTSSLTSPAHLLGQPQVASPFILTGSALQSPSSGGGVSPAAIPVQHLLIPVSTSNGTQQLISIPLSLAAGAGNQIQLLATSSGQLIATNVASITQSVSATALSTSQSSSSTSSVSSLLSVSTTPSPQQPNITMATAAAAQLPKFIAKAQGQLLAIATPQNKAPKLNATAVSLVLSSANSDHHSQPNGSIQKSKMPSTPSSLSNTIASLQNDCNLAAVSTATVTPNINQLLPNIISGSREGTIVDGVNLDEIREFAKQFKIRRLSLGLTQTQVGQALSATEGPSYSQSAICRFEKLDITPKSAQKIKPVLERWMAEAEERYKNGMQNLTEFIGSEPSKKRKRRTSFTPQALEVLNEYFERNTHPSDGIAEKVIGCAFNCL